MKALCSILVLLACTLQAAGQDAMNRTHMLRLVNEARQKGRYCGNTWHKAVPPLKWNEKLEQAAKEHCIDMSANDNISHTGSNGKKVDGRLYDQHYFWRACGENVAYGPLYEEEVMTEWLKSPGHCANIMNPAYTEMGAWKQELYWTQVFARAQ